MARHLLKRRINKKRKTTIWKHVFEGKNKSKHLQDKVVILENVLNPVEMEGKNGRADGKKIRK